MDQAGQPSVASHGRPRRFQLARHLDASHLRPARVQPAHRHPRRRHRHWRLSDGLAVDHRRDPELREARRRARHLARVALPLADSHVLVRPPLGGALHRVHHRNARASASSSPGFRSASSPSGSSIASPAGGWPSPIGGRCRHVGKASPRDRPGRRRVGSAVLGSQLPAMQYRYLWPRRKISLSTSAGDASNPSSSVFFASTSKVGPDRMTIVVPSRPGK